VTGRIDHYRTLGVPASASPDELRDAYRALARRLHPDRVVDPAARRSADDRMAKVNEAWRVLDDPDLRAAYDRSRQLPVAPSAPSVDDREYGHRGDSFDDVAVSNPAGCALRVVPAAVILVVLLGILITTALLGPEGQVPARMDAGRCVELATTVKVVPCTAETPVIVLRSVAGTTCPLASVTVMLPSRTEQVCVAPPGTPVP